MKTLPIPRMRLAKISRRRGPRMALPRMPQIRVSRIPRAAVIGVPLGLVAATAAIRRMSRHRVLANRPADVGFMRAMHDALRRDLDRLCRDTEQGDTLRAMWTEFRDHLTRHHDAEDQDLWPILRERLADKADQRHIDAMVDEHRAMTKEVELVDAAFASPEGDSGRLVNLLARTVRDHLEHEERSVLPLLERHLTHAEWHNFLMTERRRTPLRERPEFLGWVLDEANEADTAAVLAEMPSPARLVYHRIIGPRYSANHRRKHAMA